MLHEGSWEISECVVLLCDEGKTDTQVSLLSFLVGPLNWVSHGQSVVMSDAFNQKCLFFPPPIGSLQPAPRPRPRLLPTAPHLRPRQKPAGSAPWLQGRHQAQGDEGGGTTIHLITLSDAEYVYVRKSDKKWLTSTRKCKTMIFIFFGNTEARQCICAPCRPPGALCLTQRTPKLPQRACLSFTHC